MDQKTKYTKTLSVIAGAALLLALLPIWPYGYFQLLRWLVTAVAIYNGYVAYQLEKVRWVWIMGGLAVLFNPIFPIFLTREIWMVIDIMAAGLMFYSISKISGQTKN